MFKPVWLPEAAAQFQSIQAAAILGYSTRSKTKKRKASRQEGLFAQVVKCLNHLLNNPRHPGLETHEYSSLKHPYDDRQKVFEAYVQNNTPGAYRVFWCYGPNKGDLTIIAITPHP